MRQRYKASPKKAVSVPAQKSAFIMLGTAQTNVVKKKVVKKATLKKDTMKYNFQSVLTVHTHFSSGLEYMRKAHSQKLVTDHCAYMFLAIKELMEANHLIGQFDNRDYKISAFKRYLSKLLPTLVIKGMVKTELQKNIESVSRQLSNFQYFMKDKFPDDWEDHVERHLIKRNDEQDVAGLKTDPGDLEKAIASVTGAINGI